MIRTFAARIKAKLKSLLLRVWNKGRVIFFRALGLTDAQIGAIPIYKKSIQRGKQRNQNNRIAAPAIRAAFRKIEKHPPAFTETEWLQAYPGRDAHRKGRPTVLVLSEHWHACDPQAGQSNMKYLVWDSLDECGLVNQYHFYVDDFFLGTGKEPDIAVLEACAALKPDAVVNLVQDAPQVNLKFETLKCISKRLKIPEIMWCSDTVQSFTWPAIFRKYSRSPEFEFPYMDLYILTDLSRVDKSMTAHPEKYLPLPSPYDGRLFPSAPVEQDIAVSFVGNAESEFRKDTIAFLKASNVPISVYNTGPSNGPRMQYAEYVDILSRSKITLSLSKATAAYGAVEQLKGRTFEAPRCRSLLLEERSRETEYWLEPNKDYVPYVDTRDMLEKIEYYLEHEDERSKIAESGYRKVNELYNSTVYWRTVFTKVGMDV